MQFYDPDGFLMIGARLRKSDLSIEAKCALASIASFATNPQGCFVRNSYFKEFFSSEDYTVTRALKELTDRKLVESNGSRTNRALEPTEAGWALAGYVSGTAGEVAVAPAPLPTPPANDPAPEPAKPKKAAPKSDNPLAETLTADQAKKWELPDFIPRDVWERYIDVRWHDPKFKRASKTGFAAKGFVDDLTRLRGEGYDPRKLLEIAASKCWQGINDHDSAKSSGLTGGSSAAMTFGGRTVQTARGR